MRIDATLKSDAQLAECGQPSVSTIDHPAMLPEPVVALYAAASDAVFDAAQPQLRAAACEVIALVSVQLVRPAARSPRLAANGRQRIDWRLKNH